MSILFGRGECVQIRVLINLASLRNSFLYTKSWKTRALQICMTTKQHAIGLASFVSLYKTLLLLQKRLRGGKQGKADTFFAGLIGGYIVFGDRTAINEQASILIQLSQGRLMALQCSRQIVLYVCSRVLASFIPRAGTTYMATSPAASSSANSQIKPIPPDARLFSFFAALSWGAVMWLFNNRGETIQPGMFSSMRYLYRESDHWNSLRTLLWHNK